MFVCCLFHNLLKLEGDQEGCVTMKSRKGTVTVSAGRGPCVKPPHETVQQEPPSPNAHCFPSRIYSIQKKLFSDKMA